MNNPEELLAEARLAIANRKYLLLMRIWWWMRSRCKECGGKRINGEIGLIKVKICEKYPKKHKDYVWDLNLTAVFAVSTFCLSVILLAMIFGKQAEIPMADNKNIPDGYVDYPYP